jgi:hypothetical protein
VQVGLLQGSGCTPQHFGFVALHIHLPHQWRSALTPYPATGPKSKSARPIGIR